MPTTMISKPFLILSLVFINSLHISKSQLQSTSSSLETELITCQPNCIICQREDGMSILCDFVDIYREADNSAVILGKDMGDGTFSVQSFVEIECQDGRTQATKEAAKCSKIIPLEEIRRTADNTLFCTLIPPSPTPTDPIPSSPTPTDPTPPSPTPKHLISLIPTPTDMLTMTSVPIRLDDPMEYEPNDYYFSSGKYTSLRATTNDLPTENLTPKQDIIHAAVRQSLKPCLAVVKRKYRVCAAKPENFCKRI